MRLGFCNSMALELDFYRSHPTEPTNDVSQVNTPGRMMPMPSGMLIEKLVDLAKANPKDKTLKVDLA